MHTHVCRNLHSEFSENAHVFFGVSVHMHVCWVLLVNSYMQCFVIEPICAVLSTSLCVQCFIQ